MDGSIRVSARTVDDAINEALIKLKSTSDRLEYEIIEKGSPGFLGLGMKKAVIDVRVKPEKKENAKVQIKDEMPETKNESVPICSNKEEAQKEIKSKIQPEVKPKIKPEVNFEKIKDETKEAVKMFLNDTINAMGIQVELICGIDQNGALSIEMKGEDMGILIGKRGQTLDALQYLANRVANKHQEGYVRVKLDTENYREKREQTLKNLAKNVAFKVKKFKNPISLEPMNPYERRIIHSEIQNDSSVTTHSEGDDPYRKVVVTLKK